MANEVLTTQQEDFTKRFIGELIKEVGPTFPEIKRKALPPGSDGAPSAEKIKITAGISFRPLTIHITIEF